MPQRQTLLKVLLSKRHQETHRAFCLEYDKVARSIDRRLIGSSPSREAFGRWMKGHLKTKPQADHCRVLERMFPGRTVAELLAPYDPGGNGSGVAPTPSTPREAATNRREVFHLGATTMALGLTDSLWRGPDLLEQALDASSVSEARVLHLEAEVDRLGRTVPPPAVLPEALIHLASVRELLKNRHPVEAQRRLTRVGAKLAIVVGEIMFCANHFPLARRWYATATRAPDEAGDRHLADLALASTALIPTYAGDPRAALALVLPRLEHAVAATPAIAWMWGFAALAHASLGDRSAFERAINRSRYTLDRCAEDMLQPGVLSFQPERQMFYEARGRSDLGDVPGTADAMTRALALYKAEDSNDPALVRLAYASVLAKAGEIEEACHFATAAVHATQSAPSITVVVRAHEFDALLSETGSATTEWREALSTVRAPDPTALPSSS
ncbi:hypothetical protein Sme01_08910 [Sphaerisporangium melleum]|uniref:Tetratricopeptide repeat protein n=1 Tax=Sphaerisporangium melleum TaxID=321316 RepID=A0A917QVL1_9ACTN|nr:hypothetical protein [Sphaerisporangium melleum]GGK71782.1 hypothetical protein GCM10007964_13280 [Sphaerisporangium melleum]GII68415.1 hypothetical protein Sme01_08910 [Sphaerisporangium melleum]